MIVIHRKPAQQINPSNINKTVVPQQRIYNPCIISSGGIGKHFNDFLFFEIISVEAVGRSDPQIVIR